MKNKYVDVNYEMILAMSSSRLIYVCLFYNWFGFLK